MQTKIRRKSKTYKSKRQFTGHKSDRKKPFTHMNPEIAPQLKSVLAQIGKPYPAPFVPDEFQRKALDAIKQNDCLVIAPTGSGKTWIAREAILSVMENGGRAWYASPLKALSNSKWVEFGLNFDPKNVGIVSEEIMIYLPVPLNLLLLSATIGNGEQIARWLESIRKKPCTVVREENRPVPLYPLFLHPSGCIYPFLEGEKVAKPVFECMQKDGGRRMPDYGGIIRVLERFNLLPAIFFFKGRGECDAALNERA